MKRIAILFFVLPLLSCDFGAPDGFWAPAGSTVSVGAEDTSVTLLPGETIGVMVTIAVKVPYGTDNTLIPGNKIYVRGVCTHCTIYDWNGNDGRAELDESKLIDMGVTHTFSTNDRGNYTLAIQLRAPIDELGTSDAYTATFTADIEVANAFADVTVSQP